MKRELLSLTGVFLCAGLVACAAPEDPRQLSQATVQYSCGPSGMQQPLNVQYTFQGDEALAAKVIYKNQAVDLTRTTSSNTDMIGNTFSGNGYTWTTEKFDKSNVATVNGGMLTQEMTQTVNGESSTVSNILLNQCLVAGVVQ